MKKTVTPKGVEHYVAGCTYADDDKVKKTVTPKGVEHETALRQIHLGKVKKTVTPKGVEHEEFKPTRTASVKREEDSDAERR